MSPDETAGAVLEKPTQTESSPVEASSPATGLGESESAKDQPAPAKPKDDPYAKLQSQLDKERRAREQAESEAARAIASLTEAREWVQLRDVQANAPDETLYPEQAAKYWQGIAFQFRQQQQEAQRQAQVATQSQRQTEDWIATRLAAFAAETGVVVERNDARLFNKYHPDREIGRQLFLDSLNRIKTEVERERSWKEREDQIRKEEREKALKEAGIDHFDGGSTGAAIKQRRNFTREQVNDPKFYAEHREEILAEYRGGAFDSWAQKK